MYYPSIYLEVLKDIKFGIVFLSAEWIEGPTGYRNFPLKTKPSVYFELN
jgi:hypothetical protein